MYTQEQHLNQNNDECAAINLKLTEIWICLFRLRLHSDLWHQASLKTSLKFHFRSISVQTRHVTEALNSSSRATLPLFYTSSCFFFLLAHVNESQKVSEIINPHFLDAAYFTENHKLQWFHDCATCKSIAKEQMWPSFCVYSVMQSCIAVWTRDISSRNRGGNEQQGNVINY